MSKYPIMRERRKLTQNACVLCRAKRIKCDGGRPCSVCVGRDIACQYVERQWEPKRNLVSEAQRLRSQVQRSDRVLSELENTSHALQIVQWLHDGRSVDDIYQDLVTYVDTAEADEQQTDRPFYSTSSIGCQNQSTTGNRPWASAARLSQNQTISPEADLRSSISDSIRAFDAAIRPSEPTSVFPLNTGEHISPLHAEEISGNDTTTALSALPANHTLQVGTRTEEPDWYWVSDETPRRSSVHDGYSFQWDSGPHV